MKRDARPYMNFNDNISDDLGDLVDESPLDELSPEIHGRHKQKIQKYKAFENDAAKDSCLIAEPAAEETFDPSLMSDICNKAVCPICEERSSMPDPAAAFEEERLRIFAEMENFKKRLAREQEEQIRFAAESVLADLLPSLDTFELALSYGKGNEACKEMFNGLEMTHKLLLDALAVHGLEKIGDVGEPFNPEFHEAMTREARSDMPANHVSQLFQPGYKLKDRLLRPAKVVVSM